MKRSLPLGAALKAAVVFTPKALVGAWGALLLLAAVLAAPFFLMRHEPRLVTAMIVLWPLFVAGAGLVAGGALFRIGVSASDAEARRRGLGFAGLQFGPVELRLLAAAVVVALFAALIAGAVALVGVFALGGRLSGLTDLTPSGALYQAACGDGGAILMVAVAALAAWALVQLAVRLSLFKPATVARGRIVTLDAMALAEGSFWRLLAGLVVVMIPSFLLAAWLGGFVHLPALPWRGPDCARACALISSLLLAFVQVPLAAGFLSAAYKALEYHRPSGGDRGG